MSRLSLFFVLFLTIVPNVHSVPANRFSVGFEVDNLVARGREKAVKSASCTACQVLVSGLRFLIEQDAPEEVLLDFFSKTCNTLEVEQPHVCDALPHTFGKEAFYVIEHGIFTPAEICGALITDCGDFENPLFSNWTIPIPSNKPPVKPWPVPTQPKSTLRVLHLSDIHIDREYAVGSEADCGEDTYFNLYALCCRNYPPTKEAKEKIRMPAGRWGSVAKCDIPYEFFENTMKQISAKEKNLDYILITGDMQAHNAWDYTREKTQTNIANVTATLLQYFPNIPIYQAVGNHEGVPQDAFAPHSLPVYEEQGPGWMYDTLAENWGNWLPTTTQSQIHYRGSYSFKPFPDLKMISINTMYCSTWNFYLYLNQTDPDDTLAWLIDELVASEKIGEKVHIISHIPAGDPYCLKGWASNFYDIVNRFENTIAGQFYGHTHNDQFEVYYENSDPNGRPTHYNWISPSVTTYDYIQPSYRIYTIDGNYPGSSWTVLDAETYSTNVTDASIKNIEPVWTLEYNTRQAFGMPDLSPASWNDLIKRFEADDALFLKYVRYFSRNDYSLPCNADCKKKFICDLKVAKSYDDAHFCT
uniref:Sphingomyelin phosphodiesterase n=1 Tax=Plectus sambesii TaxID=2011161 RepID=A0A914XIV8_9BILA